MTIIIFIVYLYVVKLIELYFVDFMKAVAAMIIIGWMLTLTSACLIAYGMISKVEDIKLLLYRIALILMMISGEDLSLFKNVLMYYLILTHLPCNHVVLLWSKQSNSSSAKQS